VQYRDPDAPPETP